MNKLELFEKMMAGVMPASAKANGKHSFGIVNSVNNGKRITISKSLSEALDLTDTIMLTINQEDRQVFIGKTLPAQQAVTGKLSGTGKKICYMTSIVTTLTKVFNINFSTCVSRTFTDIEIVDHNGITFAVINIPEADTNTGDSEVDDESALESA
ncbi:MAG: hypothetical protein J6K70_01520 [Selenomonadales bacterium]|nr:hypothetical protein [Selenomonadales bacterium]